MQIRREDNIFSEDFLKKILADAWANRDIEAVIADVILDVAEVFGIDTANRWKSRAREFHREVNEKYAQSIKGYIKPAPTKEALTCNQVKELLDCINTYDKNGEIKSRKVVQSVRNMETILEHDQRFAGTIKYNNFAKQLFLMGNTPWSNDGECRPWSGGDDSALFSIIQGDYGLNSRNDFFDALKNVANRNKMNPVIDVLESIQYKGDGYIRRLLPEYLGAEDTDYNYEVMKLFMLGAIGRIFSPGCKFDYAMIIQGPQGIGKSTFLQMLAMDDHWFNDSLDSLDSEKTAQQLMGSWIIELAELKALSRTAGGVDSVKRFLSATQDKYRIPYERRNEIFERQCVFAGTTNRADFLQDETGNRRFLIIESGVQPTAKNLFSQEASEDIRAAWAEALKLYKEKKPVLVLPEYCRSKAQEMQENCMTDDGKRGIIEEFLSHKQRTCVLEVWYEALKETRRPAKWESTEIAQLILQTKGWKRMKSNGRFGELGLQKGFEKEDGFMMVYNQSELPFD